MWLLFHRSRKTRVVPDGEQFVETCPSCKARATFHEVQMEENVGLFFVDMFGDKQRAFRCSHCLETFEWKDQLPEGEHDDDDTHAIEAPKTWEEQERERRQERLRELTAEKFAQKQAADRSSPATADRSSLTTSVDRSTKTSVDRSTNRRQGAARVIAQEIEVELVAIRERLGR